MTTTFAVFFAATTLFFFVLWQRLGFKSTMENLRLQRKVEALQTLLKAEEHESKRLVEDPAYYQRLFYEHTVRLEESRKREERRLQLQREAAEEAARKAAEHERRMKEDPAYAQQMQALKASRGRRSTPSSSSSYGDGGGFSWPSDGGSSYDGGSSDSGSSDSGSSDGGSCGDGGGGGCD